MNTEFHSFAQHIAESASNGGLSVKQLAEIATSRIGSVNCYPGTPTQKCHPVAVFFSLQGQMGKGPGHYDFTEVMEEMIRHMQGRCHRNTHFAVLVVDDWWHEDYENWRANIEGMKRDGLRIECYLIGVGGWFVALPI